MADNLANALNAVKVSEGKGKHEIVVPASKLIREVLALRDGQPDAETTEAVLKPGPDGRLHWKLDPRYVTQRVEVGPPVRPPLWPALQAQTCPTAVVWGRSSDVLSEAQAKKMVQTLTQGMLIAVADTEHAPSLIEPESRAGLDAFFAH